MNYEYKTVMNEDHQEFLRECVHAINSDGWEITEEQTVMETINGKVHSQDFRKEVNTTLPTIEIPFAKPTPKAQYQMISNSNKQMFNSELANLCAKDVSWEPHGDLVVSVDVLGNPLYCQMMKLPG